MQFLQSRIDNWLGRRSGDPGFTNGDIGISELNLEFTSLKDNPLAF